MKGVFIPEITVEMLKSASLEAIESFFSEIISTNGNVAMIDIDVKNVECQLGWIPCSERLPEDNVPVNITWVNRKPEYYYKKIKDVPFTATGVYFRGKWYWYSSTIEDYLAEYGRAEWDEIEESMHKNIEVIAWMPLPEPYGGENE